MAAAVDAALAADGVVLFVSSSCPFCAEAEEALSAARLPYRSVEVTPAIRQELFKRTENEGCRSAWPLVSGLCPGKWGRRLPISPPVRRDPSAWAAGRYIGGCNDGPEEWMGVKPCIRSGRISELLGKPRARL
eukprot:TRINITY_DN15099_c0_g1_i2.p1 TRINITY_DN15099_c0_g1~~TRINITY_DN15099_c0_g1_i2.p1  ORF type:complete len:155 (+),score=29.80 TRINITY_DN15099_c0_g1_i2:67-465(+)